MKKNLQLPNFVRNVYNPFLEKYSEKLIIEENEFLKTYIPVIVKKHLLNKPLSAGENNIVSVLIYKSYIYTGMNGYVYIFIIKGKSPVSTGLLRVDNHAIYPNQNIYFIVNTTGFMYDLSATDSFQGFNYTKRNDYYTISETLHLES